MGNDEADSKSVDEAPAGEATVVVQVHSRPLHSLLRHRAHPRQDRAIDAVTSFSGSLSFVYLHVLWFATWIVLNSGLLGPHVVFDAFPFGLLTLLVSLEAIFLSTFVLISQNRQVRRGRVQEKLEYEADVRSEIWTILIGGKVGLEAADVERQVQKALESNQLTVDQEAAARSR